MIKVNYFSIDGQEYFLEDYKGLIDPFIDNNTFFNQNYHQFQTDNQIQIRYFYLEVEDDYFQNSNQYWHYCRKVLLNSFGVDLEDHRHNLLSNFIDRIFYLKKDRDLFIEYNCGLPHLVFKSALKKAISFDDVISDQYRMEADLKEIYYQSKKEFSILQSSLESKFLKKAKNEFDLLKGTVGIYKLYDQFKSLIFIGKSEDLLNDISSKVKELEATYFSYIIFDNYADTYIIEPYLIATLKPLLNSKTSSKPSFELEVPADSPLFETELIQLEESFKDQL